MLFHFIFFDEGDGNTRKIGREKKPPSEPIAFVNQPTVIEWDFGYKQYVKMQKKSSRKINYKNFVLYCKIKNSQSFSILLFLLVYEKLCQQ